MPIDAVFALSPSRLWYVERIADSSGNRIVCVRFHYVEAARYTRRSALDGFVGRRSNGIFGRPLTISTNARSQTRIKGIYSADCTGPVPL